MSRSRKKVWGWTDHRAQSSKIDKRFANKKVRKIYNIQNGGSFKKVYCSYNICDYKFLYFSKREALEKVIRYSGKIYKYYRK